MAFKRYIHKHGKKLGPYYYENIRSPEGKVKTVYIGTNPRHHAKHKIRKPLFFAILALLLILILGSSLFFLQNKAYLAKRVTLQEAGFDVDQILLKVLVRSNEFIEKQLRVMNTGKEPITIGIESSLPDLIKIDSGSFTIKPGQTKIVELNFSSFIPEQKIEQQPGIYIGKFVVSSERSTKEIPVIVEIETKNVLFDVNLNPVAIERRVKQGSDTTIEVRLFNLESIESVNVDVEYFVKDMNGNTIVTESETVVVKTQASFFKTISVPSNLKPGPYIFAAQVGLGSSIGTASYLFEVTGPEKVSFVQFCKDNVLCLGLSLTTILLLFALMAYFYFFVGAYLYEKVTGVVTLPERKEKVRFVKEEATKPKESIFERLRNKVRKFKEKRKAEKERLEKEEQLGRLAEERKVQFEAKRRELEEERRKQEELRKEELLRKRKELEKQKAEEEKRGKEEELRKLKEAEAKKKIEERKKKFKELFHGIGFYKTPEEKRQAALQKEKERQEREREKQEETKKREEIRRQKEFEAKRKEEELKRKKLEKEKLAKERKKKIKDFFHKVGVYKTPEEKRQAALQKEKERQERLRKEGELRRQKEFEKQKLEEAKRKQEDEARRQKELEEKQRLEEQKSKQIDEERKKQEELQRQEALRRQKELEKKRQEEERLRREEELRLQKEAEQKRKEAERLKALEEKRKAEEERRRKQEEEERKKELERQRQGQLKDQKLEAIKQFEDKITKNKEAAELLNSKLSRVKSERKPLLSSIDEIDGRARQIERQIHEKSKHIEELSLQKNSLNDRYKKQLGELGKKLENKKAAEEARIKDLKEKLATKRNELMKNLEKELSRLSPAKRKDVEKWKRLEIKAKLKLEENNLEDEIKKYESIGLEEKKEIEQSYRKALQEINSKQATAKQDIADLQSEKEQMLREKGKLSEDLQNKQNKIQKISLKLENIAKDNEQLNMELKNLKAELPKPYSEFFDKLLSSYKERAKKRREEIEEQKRLKEEEKLRLGEEKRKQEELRRQEEIRKQKGLEGQRADEERRKKEELRLQKEAEQRRKKEERVAKEEEKRLEGEERLRLREERKKQKEPERLKVEEEKRKKEERIQEELLKPREELKPGLIEKEEERKPKFKELFHKIGVYKTTEEKRQAALQKEKERQEKVRLQKEVKEIIPEKKEASWFKKLFQKKTKPLEEFKVEEEKIEEKPALEKKPTIFVKLFGKAEKKEEIREGIARELEVPEEGPKEKKLSELEELEEAIRSLDLFKKIEEKAGVKPEEPKVFEKKPKEKRPALKFFKKERKTKAPSKEEQKTARSKDLDKCYRALNDAKEALDKNDLQKAKKLYIEARNLYVGLTSEEKKEVYNELMDVYNKLK